MQVQVIEKKADPDNALIQSIEFDLIHIDAPIVNAFRRILISEIPTVAIEKVHVYNNTTLFQDEFLAHRLGLIPIKVDPKLLEWDLPDVEEFRKSLVFQLKVKCGKGKIEDPDMTRVEKSVHSSQLKWVPLPGQENMFPADDLPRSVHDDILIAKISPGQELDLKLVCVKGIGQDHTKFSPVATASYRFLPKITLNRTVTGDDANLLKNCFSGGVIDVVKNKAVVKNSRLDMCSRNIFRYDHLKDAVNMDMVDDHIICKYHKIIIPS